ncbi:zinc ribbon domain-containing protein [Rhodopseudomonas pseudopalustris]|jgi:putative FmdB family regulatory protein|uniref:Putative FmdB family regulatory protein n=1 Tax=Rhodopseudomonas faecalis TaxID=99655 RepID=A0A318TK19_9BRAD|nr:zinc ribbon domain-containing protein [Rhodopseudomonas faecalis]PYF04160.1 putative FmdB family regulatory protein [Rhodopseudomonas faecalis]TAH65345.1 MAG: zinc ribbon domain-containing protein [Rhodopseudomonas palustris]
MPIYGYTCNSCGHEFQTLVQTGETAECPLCATTDLTQQLSLIAKPAKGGGPDLAPCGNPAGCCNNCPAGFD